MFVVVERQQKINKKDSSAELVKEKVFDQAFFKKLAGVDRVHKRKERTEKLCFAAVRRVKMLVVAEQKKQKR